MSLRGCSTILAVAVFLVSAVGQQLEAAIWEVASRYPKWPFFIIRTAGVFEKPWRHKANFPLTITSRLARNDSVSVVSDVQTNITHADDLASCLVFVASRCHEIPRGCYHIANAGATTWFHVADFLRRELGCPPRVEVRPIVSADFEKSRGCDPAATSRYTCLATTKFSKLKEAPQLRTWQEAIREWVSDWRLQK